MKYVIYTRVSDIKQEDGTSPETQLEDCRKAIGKAPFLHIHDTAKGWWPTEKRPRLLKAIGELEKGDVLICRSPDRLSRNSEEVGVIKSLVRKNKATIQIVIGTLANENLSPGEWLVEKVLGLLPEYEIRILSDRLTRAHAKKKEDKEPMGFTKYGYKSVEGRLVKDEEQQHVLKHMKDLKKDGYTFREIVQTLNDERIYNTVGKPWSLNSVFRILKQEEEESQNPLIHA